MTKIIGNVESWHSAWWNCTERGYGSAKAQTASDWEDLLRERLEAALTFLQVYFQGC